MWANARPIAATIASCKHRVTRQQESNLICDRATMLSVNYTGCQSLPGSSINSACCLIKWRSVKCRSTLQISWRRLQKSVPDLHSARQITAISLSGGQDWKSENVLFLSRHRVCGISCRESWNCVNRQHCSSASLKRFCSRHHTECLKTTF